MEDRQQFDVWREDVKPAIVSKLEEFRLLGYAHVSEQEVWDCLLHKLRKEKNYIHLHQFVNTLLTLKINEYMNWLTINAYQGPNWFEENKPVNLD
ncbi:post-transcriptional regulator [Anaerobacillus sp. MEB173]|uniref:post-transcriptional regulator n=1 Tax=Anaerobacillus sp. MEB173 TaxID=3383345 RepID=UPI003F8E0820